MSRFSTGMISKNLKAIAQTERLLQWALVGLSALVAIAFGTLMLKARSQTHVVRLATGDKTGEYYAFGEAIAQVIENHHTDIQVEVIEAAGSRQNMENVQTGEVDMALVQSDTPVQPAVKAVAQLYPELFHLIADKAANIDSVSDLQGKQIALMPTGSGSYELFWPLAAHYGLSEEDFSATPMPSQQAHEALRQGEVDALFRIIGLGNQAVSNLLKDSKFELVPIQRIGALQLTQPYLQSTTIPQGTYDGKQPVPPQNLPVISVSALMVANENVEDEIVQAVTAVLYEHRNELISVNPRAANIQSPETSQNLGFPLHPGAKAYYTQDNPPFFVEYAETMGFLLSLALLVFSGIWQFRLWLIGRQKNRADDYNLEILALIEQVEVATSAEELQRLRQELFSILQQVVVDLDVDKISPESFQSFTFPWEVAMKTLHHQEMVLHQASNEPFKTLA